MDYEFITFLKDNNAWLDWVNGRYGDPEGIDEPAKFPCYVIDECVGYDDKDEEGDCKGDALFWPHFLYHDDVEEMLENLE